MYAEKMTTTLFQHVPLIIGNSSTSIYTLYSPIFSPLHNNSMESTSTVNPATRETQKIHLSKRAPCITSNQWKF